MAHVRLFPRDIYWLPGQGNVQHQGMPHASLQLGSEKMGPVEEPRMRHQYRKGRRAVYSGNTFVPPHPERCGHEREGALVVVDGERNLCSAALPLPFLVHVWA